MRRFFTVLSALVISTGATYGLAGYVAVPDTVPGISLSKKQIELPEVVVSGKRVLHIVGYVREYSTLASLKDTVVLFREKLVDFVVPDKNMKFRGWLNPRIMSSKSYYRFTDGNGTDSVSSEYSHHFSWSDWIGIVKPDTMPARLRAVHAGTDTLKAKYGYSKVWNKDGEYATLEIDVLSDTMNRRLFPMIKRYVDDDNMDFRNLYVRGTFDMSETDVAGPDNLTRMSFSIYSRGRQYDRLSLRQSKDHGYVDTRCDMYVLDREYITVKEAKKWQSRILGWDDVRQYLSDVIPPRDAEIENLIARVDAVDKDAIRLNEQPDQRLVSKFVLSGKNNFTILNRLKFMAKALNPFRKKKDINLRPRK